MTCEVFLSTESNNWVFGFGWIRWVSFCCFQRLLNPILSSNYKEIVGGSRGGTYTFSYMISPDSITTTFEMQ